MKEKKLSQKTLKALSVKPQAVYANPRPDGVAGTRECAGSGTYGGDELRVYTGRPGAMDAFAIPRKGLAT
jgi:hypothetical protein